MNCSRIEPKLSEYLNEALSAREALDVEKHLAECHPCTLALTELRHTVRLVAAAPRFELSPDFMQRLQERIDAAPVPSRLGWVQNLRQLLRPRPLSLFGATAACVVAVVMFVPRLPMVQAPPQELGAAAHVAAAASQNVVLTASDPLEDIAVANLSANPAAYSEPTE